MMRLMHHQRRLWQRLQDFTFAHKRLSLVLATGMAAIAIGLVSAAVLLRPEAVSVIIQLPSNAKPQKETPKFYSPLTGKKVKDAAATKRQVTGVMIENSPTARPQSGIKKSGVVFEAIAEGGITRFLVLYQEDQPRLIGPVRSLRPYYISWLAAFDATIAHVGGSFNALLEIKKKVYKDIDQFFNAGAYWRAPDRVAPHNVYTNFSRLNVLNKSKNFTKSIFKGFARKLEDPAKKPRAKSIDISVSSPDFNVHYDYNKKSNNYLRSIGGAPHVDREAGRIAPKTVIAMFVPTKIGFEDGYREQMNTLGSNKAVIFQDGKAIEGFWRKKAKRQQIQFYDKNAHIIQLNPGQTWITAIAPGRSVTWQ